MVSASMVEVVRDIVDAGIRVRVTIPSTWSELEVEGVALVVSGQLEENPETLVPSLQLRVQHAENAAATESAVRGVAGELREAAVVVEHSGTGRAGYPETVLEVAHRSEVTGATQISMFRSLYLPEKSLAVTAVATCGGGASEEARDQLRTIVASVAVESRP